MKALWVLGAVAGIIYVLTTDSAQSVLQSDAMESAHNRGAEIDRLSAPTVAQESKVTTE